MQSILQDRLDFMRMCIGTSNVFFITDKEIELLKRENPKLYEEAALLLLLLLSIIYLW